LFLATVATLMLEILDSRLLSVLTWYHLAFFAVSLAMLGMAAGAVLVFLEGKRLTGERAIQALPRSCLWLAAAIPLSHVLNLYIPIPVLDRFTATGIGTVAFATIVLGAPFLVAGIVVTLALTRAGGPTGRLYAADLIGAALGCLLVIPLLDRSNISSVAFVAGAVAASGAYCFQRFAAAKTPRSVSIGLAVALLVAAGLNAVEQRVGVVYAKDRRFNSGKLFDPRGGALRSGEQVAWSAWNTHSYISISPPFPGPAYYWGRGHGGEQFQTTSAWVLIDADAGTPITKWDGKVADLEWVSYDVSTLPYHLRKGRVGIIGVGGGRDILSALWGGNSSITGIEINNNMLRALSGPYREFANIVTRPEVDLVHSEARSFLSRTDKRFDILQMSLIDTWASTGAGAFTLTENGLYTIEAWRLFLNRLTPGGLFSVSRWFSPQATSETSRLLALAVAALLDRGVSSPVDHMAMLAKEHVATLVVSNEPMTEHDRAAIMELAAARQFDVLIAPGSYPVDPWLAGIVRASSLSELNAAIRHPMFDFTPPTDDRPFFFNTLKPANFYKAYEVPRDGVIWGNLRATWTLVLLLCIATVLVAAIIVLPLLLSGLPTMDAGSFGTSVAYFATIGIGYMLIQIPFLQRFSVYLGHPTYTFAIILFSMVFFTGIGSFLSDRFPVERHTWVLWLPLAIGVAVAAIVGAVQPLMDATIQLGLGTRALVVVACTAPLSVLLGFCFPLGMSLVGRLSPDATAWMWGVNGAAGVLASIVAVGISMWLGIHVNLLAAAALYTLLTIPLRMLARKVDVLAQPAPSRASRASA
jgi:spermidine synthase